MSETTNKIYNFLQTDPWQVDNLCFSKVSYNLFIFVRFAKTPFGAFVRRFEGCVYSRWSKENCSSRCIFHLIKYRCEFFPSTASIGCRNKLLSDARKERRVFQNGTNIKDCVDIEKHKNFCHAPVWEIVLFFEGFSYLRHREYFFT